jgi:hypothetical protein
VVVGDRKLRGGAGQRERAGRASRRKIEHEQVWFFPVLEQNCSEIAQIRAKLDEIEGEKDGEV